MTTTIKLIVYSMVMAIVAVPFSPAMAAEKPFWNDPKPVVEPVNSRIVTEGHRITIGISQELRRKIDEALHTLRSTSPEEKFSLDYQWLKNTSNVIKGATDDMLTLNEVKHGDAGSYTVKVSGVVNEVSAPIHISVFTPKQKESDGGALTVPIEEFSSGEGVTVCNVTGFDRWREYRFFYGSNIQNQLPPFTNYGYAKLTVNTCSNINTSVNTAINIVDATLAKNVLGGCNDKHQTPCAVNNSNNGVSRIPSPVTLTNDHYYTVTIYYKSGSLGNQQTIGWSWLYRN